ncbi:MAG TPA: serine/threonine-protein kinase [Polyangiaceae bacterium]|jgi:serine/threonine protein kinase|nr:serine/threonine-protein kinase [Polyangiaceae bacterium]
MGDEVLRDGRYRVVGKLGEGAQGTTFDAIDAKTGTAVAIKRFSVRGAKSWKDVELAEREATVLETLSHPALPAHIEHFEEDGALYLVMQKIEGKSLAHLTAKGGALSRDDVVRFMRDAGSVLDYLHGRSPPVIHRDINPKNFIRRPDGSFALVDFGAVRDRLKPEGGSTIVGTYGYMAPEQLQGRALPATDVYSVGATALRLLTGREPETLPHRGLSIDVNAALGSSEPVLRDVLAKMLDPDPDRRASKLGPLLKRLEQADRGAASTTESRSERERRAAQAAAAAFTGSRRDRGERDERSRGNWEKSAQDWVREAQDFASDAEQWGRGARARARDQYRRSRSQRKRAEAAARRSRRRGRPLNGPPLLLAVIGLNLAMFVVGLMLGVVVPTVLVLLSILFGRPLRDAARATRVAGEDARRSMTEARDYLLHGPGTVTEAEPIDVEGVSADERPRTRVRVSEDDVETSADDQDSVDSDEVRRAHR